MKIILFIALLCIAIQSSLAGIYSEDSEVIQLNDSNFKQLVMNSNELWLVKFSANWCGHCKALAPEYTKLAKAAKGVFKIGVVDMDESKQLGSQYQIKGTPTLKFFGEKKSSPQDYEGQRDAKSMLNFLFEEAKKMAMQKLGGGSSSSSSSNKKSDKSSSKKGEVIVLTEANFDELVMKTNDVYFIKFYAPWCGHCKSLAPVWIELAGELAGEVKVAEIDATQNQQLAQRFGVQGYPTLKFFNAEKKGDSSAIPYEGGRDLSSLKQFALEQRNKYRKASFKQLINQEIYDKLCASLERGACFIAFMPHIYDVTAEERKTSLKMIKNVAEKNKLQPITFLWAQGGDFLDYEQFLNLGTGYPTFFGVSHSKKVYTHMQSAFTEKNLQIFIDRFLQGREAITKMKPEIPKIPTVEKWDGKDKKPVQEDLNDLNEEL